MHDGMGGGVAQGGGHLEALRHLAMIVDEVGGKPTVAVAASLTRNSVKAANRSRINAACRTSPRPSEARQSAGFD